MALVSIGTSVAKCTPTSTPAAPELLIELRPDQWVQYQGCAAQLRGEGLIPTDFRWPDGRADGRWTAGGMEFWLRRMRPPGHKGSYASWADVDYWLLRVSVAGRTWNDVRRRQLERRAAELVDELYALTPAGNREWESRFARYWQAKEDGPFQSFLAGVLPQRKRPGRPRKARPGVGVRKGLGA